MANQLEYFSQLLQEIYDAAIDPARWEACLNTIASIVQANNASLIVRHGSADGLGTIVTGAGKNRRGSGANPFYMSSPFIGLPLNQIVTIGDFLRAAGRGEITLRAIVHTAAKVQKHDGGIYCNGGQENENRVPAGAIATLPLTACQHLANAGRASWRTFDGFDERIEARKRDGKHSR